MSKIPKASNFTKSTGIPVPRTLGTLTNASSLVSLAAKTDVTNGRMKDTQKIPTTLRGALSRKSKTETEFKRRPLKVVNRTVLTIPENVKKTPLKRPCPIVPDVKTKVAKIDSKPTLKTGRKSLRQSTVVKKPAKPPAYDYKARFGILQDKHTITVSKLKDAKEKLSSLEDRNEDLEAKTEELEKELTTAQEELGELRQDAEIKGRELEILRPKFKIVCEKLQITEEELKKVKSLNEHLNSKCNELEEKNGKLETQNKYLSNELDIKTKRMEEFKQQFQQFDLERRKLHNEIQDLKGNIRVFCRIRPPLSLEKHRNLYGISYLDDNSIEIRNGKESMEPGRLPNGRLAQHQFSFDKVFTTDSTQKEIFVELSQLVQSVLDGYNVCVFAYGQTGSGKTYTMEGGDSEQSLGMIPRATDFIFESLNIMKEFGWSYRIEASFVEIYNEKIHDLLNLRSKDLEIRMTDQTGTDVYITNLTTADITSARQLRQLMSIAQQNRAVAATENNERSSRSHSVTKIQIEGFNHIRNEKIRSSLNLVDLAGSEKIQTVGTCRVEETKNINKSLATLAHVILTLKEKKDHIPYRNCKLTYLLMPSLGGNSKTLMLVNVSPFEDCFSETVNSLRFATNVNQCRMGTIKKNKIKCPDVTKTPQGK